MPAPVRSRRKKQPVWPPLLLAVCALAVLVYVIARGDGAATTSAQATQAAAATAAPATPEPTVPPTPTPIPYDYTQPVPLGGAVDQEEWFSDAVMIGDSRIDGFKLFSGVTPKTTFLDYTGLTVFDVIEQKPVIRLDGKKVPVLEALSRQPYGKVYISLGLNELGYYDPPSFGEVYAQLLDSVKQCQPGALIYVQTIIPVNAAKCKANDIPKYITNEGVLNYNEVLKTVCADKQVRMVGIPETLVDDNGEMVSELSADGVHFKREGYKVWLDYLITHTGS